MSSQEKRREDKEDEAKGEEDEDDDDDDEQQQEEGENEENNYDNNDKDNQDDGDNNDDNERQKEQIREDYVVKNESQINKDDNNDQQKNQRKQIEKEDEDRNRRFEERLRSFRNQMTLQPGKNDSNKVKIEEEVKKETPKKKRIEEKINLLEFFKDIIIFMAIEIVQCLGNVILYTELKLKSQLDSYVEDAFLKSSFGITFFFLTFLCWVILSAKKSKNSDLSINYSATPQTQKETTQTHTINFQLETNRKLIQSRVKEPNQYDIHFLEDQSVNRDLDNKMINTPKENGSHLIDNINQQFSPSLVKKFDFFIPNKDVQKDLISPKQLQSFEYFKSNKNQENTICFNSLANKSNEILKIKNTHSQMVNTSNFKDFVNKVKESQYHGTSYNLFCNKLLFGHHTIMLLEKMYFLAAIYVIIVSIIRLELLIIRPLWQIYSLSLTVIIGQLIFCKLKRMLGLSVLTSLCFYCSVRILIGQYGSILLFIMSITCSLLPLSIQLILKFTGTTNQERLIITKEKCETEQEIQPEDKKPNKQQYVTEYFKQFYHNIVSMMPQGILIIDQSKSLVYANKTTKHLLRCSSQNQILSTLKSLRVKPTTAQGGMTPQSFFEDQKTLRTLRTMRSLKTMKSIHIKKSKIMNNSIPDTESLVSSCQELEKNQASDCLNKDSIIKPIVSSFSFQINYDKSNQSSQTKNANFIGNKVLSSSISHGLPPPNIAENGGSANNLEQLHPTTISEHLAKVKSCPQQPFFTSKDLLNEENITPTHAVQQGKTSWNSNTPNFITNDGKGDEQEKIEIKKLKTLNKIVKNKEEKRFENKSIMDIISELLKECAGQIISNSMTAAKNRKCQEFSNKIAFNLSQDKEDKLKVIQKQIPNSADDILNNINQHKFNSNRNINSQILNNNQYGNSYNLNSQSNINSVENSSQNLNSNSNNNNNISNNNNFNQCNFNKRYQLRAQTKEQIESSKNMARYKTSINGQKSKGIETNLGGQSSINAYQSQQSSQVLSQLGTQKKANFDKNQDQICVRIQVDDRLLEITFLQCQVKALKRLYSSQEQKYEEQNLKSNLVKTQHQNGNHKTVLFQQKDRNEQYTTTFSNAQQKQSTNKSGDSKKEQFGNHFQTYEYQSSHRNLEYKKGNSLKMAVIVVFIEDITHEIYVQKLEELNLYKMKMLSSISHELKTPLNCSMGMLDELSAFVSSEEFGLPDSSEIIQSLIEPAQQSNMLLLHMIRDLLDLGTLELGALHYSFTRFNLKNLLEDCCKVMKSQAELKKINIQLIFNASEIVISDENRIGQIILNFLSNSLKFTNKNGKIIVKVEPYQSDCKISVEDNGLGLTVSYKLAQGLTLDEFQDRPIQVNSEEKKGSIFSFILKNQNPDLISDKEDEEEEDEEEGESEKGENIKESNEGGIQPNINQNYVSQRQENQTYEIPEVVSHEMDENETNLKKSQIQIQQSPNQHLNTGEENIYYDAETEYGKINLDPPPVSSQMNLVEKYFHDFKEDSITGGAQIPIKNSLIPFLPHTTGSSENTALYELQGQLQLCIQDNQQQPQSIANQQQKDNNASKSHAQAQAYVEETSIIYRSGKLPSSLLNNSQLVSVNAITTNGVINNIINTMPLKGDKTLESKKKIPYTDKSIPASIYSSVLTNTNGNNTPKIFNLHKGSSYNSLMDFGLVSSLDEFIALNVSKKTELMAEQFGQILIVDDVQFNLLTLSSLLKKYSLKIEFAHDGQEAINKVKEKYTQTGKVFLIIFMDIQMPIKDGFEATLEIRSYLSSNSLFQVPIIATTAFADQSYKEQAKKVGMTDYIEKPLQIVKIDKSFAKHVLK